LVGGEDLGHNILSPAVVANTSEAMRIRCEEVFGPVVTIDPFETLEEAIALANDSVFGLQAAVFTRDLDAALKFARDLHYGCVWINEASRYRQDNYPFGGVKDSGLGREGMKYAIQEMTECKFVGIKTAL
jgi:acyl-CoA reductase-like NAD-dependent aldehyde dehydrogenase